MKYLLVFSDCASQQPTTGVITVQEDTPPALETQALRERLSRLSEASVLGGRSPGYDNAAGWGSGPSHEHRHHCSETTRSSACRRWFGWRATAREAPTAKRMRPTGHRPRGAAAGPHATADQRTLSHGSERRPVRTSMDPGTLPDFIKTVRLWTRKCTEVTRSLLG